MSAPRTERSPLGAFSPTHAAPAGGMPAWETPDSAGTTTASLDADVRFRVTERRGDWARIECSNGWSAWVEGRRMVALASPTDATRSRESIRDRLSTWLGSWQPPASWPPWLSRAIGLGPLLGSGFAGALLYIPSHSVGQSFTTSFLMLGVIGGLRALDPTLKPVWAQLDRIPRRIRMAAGVLLPIWYSISQFGPSAAGHEVGRAQTAVLVSSAMAFVLLRPPEEHT